MKAIILSATMICLMIGAPIIAVITVPVVQAFKHLEKIPGTANHVDYQSGYKVGYADALAGERYHHSKTDNASTSWGDGYSHGWNKDCVKWGNSQGLENSQENCDLLADASSP